MKSNSRIFLLFALSLLIESFTGSALRAETPASGSTEIAFFAGISAPVNHESRGFGLDVKTGTPIGGRVSYNFNGPNAVASRIAHPFSLSANCVHNFSAFREKWSRNVRSATAGPCREIALSDNNQPAQL